MSFLNIGAEWFVVIRKARGEETKRGKIVGRFDNWEFAKQVAHETQSQLPEFNVWVINRSDY